MSDSLVLASLLSAPTLAVMGADLAGTITWWSEGATVLYGWCAEQAVGRPLVSLSPPELQQDTLARRALVLAGGPQAPYDTVRVHRDGTLLDVEVHAVALRDQQGRVVGSFAVHRDLSRARAAEQAVVEQAEQYSRMLAELPVAVFAYGLDGVCTSSDGRALASLGLAPGQLVGTDLLAMYADAPESLAALRAALAGQEAVLSVEVADRSWIAVYQPVRDASGEVASALGIALDITAQRQAEQEVQAQQVRQRGLLQHASDVALLVGEDGRVQYAGPSVAARFGHDEADLVGQRAIELDHPEDRSLVKAAWRRAVGQEGVSVTVECRVLHGDGSWRWAEHVLTSRLEDPDLGGVVVNVRDTTDRHRAELELRRLALQDALTGLANRALLLDRTAQALAREDRTGTRTGLVVLDVVGMGALNARLGEQGGDQALVALAARLTGSLRPLDTAARVGGDELAVLFEEVASQEDLRARTAALVDDLQAPLDLDGTTVEVRVRAGSALSPAVDAGSLLAAAEGEVRGRSGQAGGRLEQAAVSELRRGVRQGQLVVHYQPVLHLATGELAGVEALVRWQHPVRGLLAPAAFVPLAERSGVVVELGARVLAEAAVRLAEWQDRGLTCGIGVNVAPQQLVQPGFVELVARTLADAGADPHGLVLEVTESALMDDPSAPAVLQQLHATGVRLALDDFGTGYSSLSYLRRFTLDAIKVDRSFVSGLGRDRDDEAIVASVVSLARAVDKLVVAEGVETAGQLAALRALGVDQVQGFLLGRPVPWEQVQRWTHGPVVLPASPEPSPLPTPRAVVEDDPDVARLLALHRQGASLHTVAAALNNEGRRTPSGVRWSTTSVARVVSRTLPSR